MIQKELPEYNPVQFSNLPGEGLQNWEILCAFCKSCKINLRAILKKKFGSTRPSGNGNRRVFQVLRKRMNTNRTNEVSCCVKESIRRKVLRHCTAIRQTELKTNFHTKNTIQLKIKMSK